jgi:predicted PurR-regulated permease PerM
MLEWEILLDMAELARPQLLAWAAIALAIGYLVWLLSPILAPFLFAAILAYILRPLVERMSRQGAPRALAVVLVLLLALAALAALALVIVPLLYKEGRLLAEKLPGLLDWLTARAAPWLSAKLNIDLQLDVDSLKQMARDAFAENEDLVKRLLRSLGIGGLALFAFLANLLLVPVVLFYLLRDWNALVRQIDNLLPRRIHAKAVIMAGEIDLVLAEWLRGQMLVVLIMSIYYVTALWLAGLQFALPIGLFLATAAAVMQFDTWSGVFWVWLAIGIGQALEGMAVTPLVVGNRIGLHPIAVIFALLAFGQVFGFFGVLLALPASAVLLVALRHLRAAYVAGPLYGHP